MLHTSFISRADAHSIRSKALANNMHGTVHGISRIREGACMSDADGSKDRKIRAKSFVRKGLRGAYPETVKLLSLACA